MGTSASVVGLIGAAFTIVREIRTARDNVRGATKTLDDTSQQLATLERSLGLVEEEESLQTADVVQQVRAITGVAEEMKVFFDRLAIGQQKSTAAQFMHALKSGAKEDGELRGILDRLDRAKAELVLRISVAQVGLVGNLRNGFRVAFGVLTETNDKVKQVLGINLALMDRLRDRALQQTGTCRLGSRWETRVNHSRSRWHDTARGVGRGRARIARRARCGTSHRDGHRRDVDIRQYHAGSGAYHDWQCWHGELAEGVWAEDNHCSQSVRRRRSNHDGRPRGRGGGTFQ